MQKINYYLLVFLLIFSLSCSDDEIAPDESKKDDNTGLVWPEEAVDISLPEVAFTEWDRIASGMSSNVIRDRMIDLVDATPEDATIYISIYAFHDFPYFVSAFERANSRNVRINLMLDASDHNEKLIARNQVYVEELKDLANVTIVQVNNSAGSIAINHNKFILLSEIVTENGAVEKVVFQTSHNFAEGGTRKIQDAVTLANDGLYDAYRDYWQDMRKLAGQGMENYEYREYHDPEEGITAMFYPRRNGGVIGDDNILTLLNDITDPASTSIKVGMSGWSASRSSILDKLEVLYSQGADVQIVTKKKIASSLQDQLAAFAEKGAFVKIYDQINIHSKIMIIEGEWRGEPTNLVLMGSQNFTNNAYKYNNEVSLLFQDHEFFPIYRDYFEEIKELPGLCCQ